MKTPDEMSAEISEKCHSKAAVWFDRDKCEALLTAWRDEAVEEGRQSVLTIDVVIECNKAYARGVEAARGGKE